MIKAVHGGESRLARAKKYLKEFKGMEAPSMSVASGDLLAAADSVATYIDSNMYQYKGAGSGNYNFPIANYPNKKTLSCSSFIQEVLYQAGYEKAKGKQVLYANTSASTMKYYFTQRLGISVEVITDITQVQPGDIIEYSTSAPHLVMAYNVSGNNVRVKGVPECLNYNVGGEYAHCGNGKEGKVRKMSYLRARGSFIIRIKD